MAGAASGEAARVKRVAVDLTPLLAGGDNGGAKPLAIELVRRLAAVGDGCEFVLLTAEQSHAELALLDAPNVRRLCVSPPKTSGFSGVRIPLQSLLRTLLPERVLRQLGAWHAGRTATPPANPLLSRIEADLLFCPFTGALFYDPAVPVVSLVHDLQYLYYPEFFTSAERAERDRHFRQVCRVATRLVCVSEYTRTSVLEHSGLPPERVVAIPSAPQKRLPESDAPEPLPHGRGSVGRTPASADRPMAAGGPLGPAKGRTEGSAAQSRDSRGVPAGLGPTEVREDAAGTRADSATQSRDREGVPMARGGPPKEMKSPGGGSREINRLRGDFDRAGEEQTSGRYLLYPANFWRHKNHELLLIAFGIYRTTHPQSDLKLVLTGAPSPRRDELMEAARRMGLSDRVIFPGYLADADFAALLRGALAMIFPSLFEGFGMPVLEAMAAGVPVLCGNLTSLPEIAGDAALLFDPRRPAEIVAAIERLETDPALRAELAERGRSRAAEFIQPEEWAARYWAVFEDAIGHPVERPSTVYGVFPDGWTGPRITVVFGRGATPRRLTLTLRAPEWLPSSEVAIRAGAETHRIPRGQRKTIALDLPGQAGAMELLCAPVFEPGGEDLRQLGCLLEAAAIEGAPLPREIHAA
jgi:glycosyltransferase involved in cell wall biosynthesis